VWLLDGKQYAWTALARRTLIKKVQRILQCGEYLSADHLAEDCAATPSHRRKKQNG
jgi:hypothetical protein